MKCSESLVQMINIYIFLKHYFKHVRFYFIIFELVFNVAQVSRKQPMKLAICILVPNKFLVSLSFMCYYFSLFSKKMRNKMFHFTSLFCVYISCIRALKSDGVELPTIVKDRPHCFNFHTTTIRGHDIISYTCSGVYHCAPLVQGKYLYDDDLVKHMHGTCSFFFSSFKCFLQRNYINGFTNATEFKAQSRTRDQQECKQLG